MVKENWEPIEGKSNLWLPEIGDVLIGEVKELKQGNYGLQATIKTKDGEIRTPSHIVLQNRLEEVKIGDYLKITYLKDELPSVKGRNPTRIYKVERKVIEEEQVEE